MNDLEATFLSVLSEKLAKTDASADFASMKALMDASKQTPEDWARLAEQTVSEANVSTETKVK